MFTKAIDCINWIENIERFNGPRKNLDRMKLALKILGNPEENFKIIHVAGTNGKGSTVTFIKYMLVENGYNVGSFVSPYIISFNERINYNYGYISDDDLILYTNTIYQVYELMIKEYNEHLTFFEVLTLVGICYFYAKKCDYVILEVGLGGLLDATNFCNAVCSVITNIGFDHMAQLGNTLEEIALNKLGIVKEGNHLITTVSNDLKPLFTEYINNNNATVEFIDTEKIKIYNTEYTSFAYGDADIDLSVIGLHQAYNATLAIKVVEYLDSSIPLKKLKKDILNATWPGRLEVMKNKPKVIIDGGHNIHGIEALVKTIDTFYKNPIIIFACLADKETKKMVNLLASKASKMIITEIDYYRAKNAKELFDECNHNDKLLIPSYEEAIDTAIKFNQNVIITGSLYFISKARAYLKSK